MKHMHVSCSSNHVKNDKIIAHGCLTLMLLRCKKPSMHLDMLKTILEIFSNACRKIYRCNKSPSL